MQKKKATRSPQNKMFKLSQRDLIWESNDIITHVPGDNGSISDIKYIDIDQLPSVSHALDPENVEKIMKQFQEAPGTVQSVVINENEESGKWEIVDGAHRLEAARRLGISKAPVRFWSKEEGQNWQRDLENYHRAWSQGNYKNINELKDSTNMLINKSLSDMVRNDSSALLAADLLIYLGDFNLMLQSLGDFYPNTLAYNKLNKYIGDNF